MYMPHAYDPDVHYPARRKGKDLDFSFIGTMFESRMHFFEELFSNLDMWERDVYRIALGGAAWDGEHLDNSPLLRFVGHPRDQAVDNQETADTYRRSRLGINFYRRESEKAHAGEGWAVGPREIELAACGVPWIRDPRGESDELFPFLPTFSTAGEAADLMRWYLADEDRRDSLGKKARAAIEERTFINHANMLMDEMSKFGLL
jgi:glycosyltransferase involved in cell wall biosynthesis